jgi:hypothetical protein
MKMVFFTTSLAFIFLTFFANCENETITANPIDPELDYANIQVGRSWEYRYDTINYLSGGVNKVSNKGFIKISIEEDLSNGKYRVLKAIKKDSIAQYTPFRAEILQLGNNILTSTDNNLTFINLVFPPKEGTIWNGNRLFNDQLELTINDEFMIVYSGWEYVISKVDTTLTVFGKEYPKTLEVTAGPKSENLIARRVRKEYYTKGVGLTKVQMEVLNTQKILPNTDWKDKAESGFIYTQELIRVN